MSKQIFVNRGGTFTEVQDIYANSGGNWNLVKEVYVNQSGTWVKTYPQSGSVSYNTPGSQSFTVPAGIHSLNVTLEGGGGGGGGTDAYGGYAGYAGDLVTGTIAVNPGDTVTVSIGGGGGAGGNNVAGTGGGAGGSSDVGFYGGTGGYAGNEGVSGGGGGGGAATVVLVNGTIVMVAAGGGGGGGGGDNSNGRSSQGYASNDSNFGGNGENKTSGGEHGGGGKIICTKLYELGLMDYNIYEADQAFGAELLKTCPDIYNGYRSWAKVVVDWMDGSDGKFVQSWAIKWAKDIATPWAKHMAYKMGAVPVDNYVGRVIALAGLPVCKFVGIWNRKVGIKVPAVVTKLTLINIFAIFKIISLFGKK